MQICRPFLPAHFGSLGRTQNQRLRLQVSPSDRAESMQAQPDLQRMLDGPDLSLMRWAPINPLNVTSSCFKVKTHHKAAAIPEDR